jgi:hypothetical protein
MPPRRRDLLLSGVAGLAGGWSWDNSAPMPGRILGANAALGHRLRDGNFPEPSFETRCNVVIAGGGIAGLSAGWRLAKRGVDFTLVELERDVGGNAASGRNAVSAYPWGAHYIPRLTREARYAAELFAELGVITGYGANGAPIYNEFYLCADPRERLFILGSWQEDLLPMIGAGEADRRQYQEFFTAMDRFRAKRGADGRKAFAIPMAFSSADPEVRALDQISMTSWMQSQGFTSSRLAWYVDYCCRDDFGTHAAEVSAWAGIHYFAARDAHAADDDTPTVLTWPEGNGWVVGQLKQRLAPSLVCAQVVWRVRAAGDGVSVDVFDPAKNLSYRLLARAAILAVPHFVADKLLDRSRDSSHSYAPHSYAPHTYAPWMVANVTCKRMPSGAGMPLCWDNVVYDSPSLGYVVATHQALERVPLQTVLTYYWPLCDQPPEQARQAALGRPLADWQATVLDELLRIHPELTGAVASIDVWLWGHGMIRPTPGYIWGAAREAACVQTPPVFFAHSDMSGLSLFEEANYRGVVAADAVAGYLRT